MSSRVDGRLQLAGGAVHSVRACSCRFLAVAKWNVLNFGPACGGLLRPWQASKGRRRRSGLRGSGPSLQTVQEGRWGAVLKQGRTPFFKPAVVSLGVEVQAPQLLPQPEGKGGRLVQCVAQKGEEDLPVERGEFSSSGRPEAGQLRPPQASQAEAAQAALRGTQPRPEPQEAPGGQMGRRRQTGWTPFSTRWRTGREGARPVRKGDEEMKRRDLKMGRSTSLPGR